MLGTTITLGLGCPKGVMNDGRILSASFGNENILL